ncbi:MAG: protein kinase domain-containing protein [Myxococcota bacterium]
MSESDRGKATPDAPASPQFPEKIGAYRVDRLLGEGASAQVFLATHELTGQVVALKVLRRELEPSLARQVRTRFLLEQRIAATIRDPRIVKVYEASVPGEEPYFIAMEYLEAEPFCDYFERRRVDSSVASRGYLSELYRLGYEVAKAMAAAHARGVVHRDLKPDNVLVSRREARSARDRVKIVDFGIAKAPLGVLAGVAATFTPHHTELGTVMGSPPYMAPEQYGRAHAVTGKADVFALGIMLTLAAVGLDHDSLEMNRACWTLPDDFERALALGPPLPEALERLLRRMVAESPEDRPEMRDVALVLGKLAQPNEDIAEAVFAYASARRIPARKELLRLLSELEDQTDLTDDEHEFVRQAPASLLAGQKAWGRRALGGALALSSAALGALYLRTHQELLAAQKRADDERASARGNTSALQRDLVAEAEHRQVLLARADTQERRLESLDKSQLELKRDARVKESRLSQCRATSEELRECTDQRDLFELSANERKNELARLKSEFETLRREAEMGNACQRELDAKNSALAEASNRLRLCNEGLRRSPTEPAAGEP